MSRFLDYFYNCNSIKEGLSNEDKQILDYLNKQPKDKDIYGIEVETLIIYVKQDLPNYSKMWKDEFWQKLEKAKNKIWDDIK